MVELTIKYGLNGWFVAPKYITANRMVHPIIQCDTNAEAWAVFEALNGKPLLEIESFIKARRRIGGDKVASKDEGSMGISRSH